MAVTKICTKCKEEKPLIAFHNNPKSSDGKHTWCAICKNLANKLQWNSLPQKERKQKSRQRQYKFRYNITIQEYNSILDEQNFKCAICESSDVAWRGEHYSVDHDHATGKVRGLLCGDCNVGIGKFKDNSDLLFNAIIYLNKNTDILGNLNGNIISIT